MSTLSHPSPQGHLAGRFSRLLQEAFVRLTDEGAEWKARDAVGDFGDVVRSAAVARRDQLGVDDAFLNAVVGQLLPARLGTTLMSIRCSGTDAADLRAFLVASADIARESISSAPDEGSLADNIIVALDNLHSFVLTHGLVPRDYLESRSSASAVTGPARRTPTRIWEEVRVEEAAAEDVGAARKNDLALAA